MTAPHEKYLNTAGMVARKSTLSRNSFERTFLTTDESFVKCDEGDTTMMDVSRESISRKGENRVREAEILSDRNKFRSE